MRRPTLLAGPIPAALGLALVAWLAAGCSEQTARPTSPFSAPEDPLTIGDWTRVYPEVTVADLDDVWALDSDDVWAVGSDGTVLHHDGQHVTSHAFDRDERIIGVDGTGHDDVWVHSDDHVWHWDGRDWDPVPIPLSYTWAYDLEALDAADDGALWLAVRRDLPVPEGDGHVERRLPVVLRRAAGGQWDQWVLSDQQTSRMAMWTVAPGGPRIVVSGHPDPLVHHFTGAAWEPLDWTLAEFYAADGDLVSALRQDGEQPPTRGIFRIGDDLSLSPVCEGFSANIICRSRTLLLASTHEISGVSGCQAFTVLDNARAPMAALAVPERAGAAGPVVLAVGDEGLLLRGAWREDWTMTWSELIPQPSTTVSSLVADGTTLVAEDDDRVFVCEADGAGWTVEDAGLDADGLVLGGDGHVYAYSRNWLDPGAIARRTGPGQWQSLPRFPGELLEIAVDAAGRVAALSWPGRDQVWVLEDGQWDRLDPPGGLVDWIGLTPAGDLFALVELERVGTFLVHHDGHIWRDISPAELAAGRGRFWVSPVSGRLVGLGYRENPSGPSFTWYLERRDGSWQLDGPLPLPAPYEIFQETPDGTLWAHDGGRLFRRQAGTWEYVLDDQALDDAGIGGISHYWVVPGRGIYGLGSHHILHHPLPSTR